MPVNERNEPGRATVEQRERGDPRQHEQPIDKQKGERVLPSQDQPPADSPRDRDSPWMGGG